MERTALQAALDVLSGYCVTGRSADAATLELVRSLAKTPEEQQMPVHRFARILITRMVCPEGKPEGGENS